MILKLEVSRYPGLPRRGCHFSLRVSQGFSKLWKVIFISFYLPRNSFAILFPSFVHEELSSMAWKLKHIQTISLYSIPVNVNPINIFSAEPFIERYLVSLSKTLKLSTWKLCSSFLWLKFSNIQPNGGSNPHRPPPKQTPVQRLPVDLHQGEPRRADMADEMWKCAEMITFSLVSIVFLLFPAFFGKIQLQVNNNRQSKTGLPTWQLSQTVNTCLKKT